MELVENLGANIIAHCQIGNARFTVNLDSNANFKAGADLNIIVDMDKTHFFNSISGELI